MPRAVDVIVDARLWQEFGESATSPRSDVAGLAQPASYRALPHAGVEQVAATVTGLPNRNRTPVADLFHDTVRTGGRRVDPLADGQLSATSDRTIGGYDSVTDVSRNPR